MSIIDSPVDALDRIREILRESESGEYFVKNKVHPRNQHACALAGIEAVIEMHFGIESEASIAIILRESEARLIEIQQER